MTQEQKQKNPKLHEILAVEGDLAGKSEKVRDETVTTFTKRKEHFEGRVKRLRMFDEGDKQLEEAGAEYKEMVTTVGEKLKYLQGSFVKYWDAVLQKEATNQEAKADLVVDGSIIAEKLPATFLLGMENKLKELRAVYDCVPTWTPGVKWVAAAGERPGVYRMEPDELALKTKKMAKSTVLYDATKEHPAQIEKWFEDVPIGEFVLTRTTGALSPAEKSALLGRVDTLIRAVKKARQRANATDVVKMNVGKKLFDFIHANGK